MADVPTAVWWILGAAVALVFAVLLVAYVKGRPFAQGSIFRASRLSRGNRLLPTQVLITPTSVVHFTPQWIGRAEQTIHIAHVASVKIDTGALLSDVVIETSGGASSITCHGHHKADAIEMKELIGRYQTTYYRRGPGPGDSPADPLPSDR